MEIKEFIEKTNNFIAAARIITKQAKMDCDGLIEECDDVITMMEKMRNELLALRQEEEKTR